MRLAARRACGVTVAAVLLVALTFRVGAQQIPGASTDAAAALARGEWPTYAGTYASAKYSPLDQINAANVGTLKVAWRWTSPDHAVRAANPRIDPSMIHQGTPIMVNGVLYTSTSLSQVAAIDAGDRADEVGLRSGLPQARMPTNLGWLHRGVAYWRDWRRRASDHADRHAFMIALDAKTGRPIEGFGTKGSVDLSRGPRPAHSRPAGSTAHVAAGDRPRRRRGRVLGAGLPRRDSMPVGDVRGFDIRTGQRLWTFRAVPGPARSATRRGRTTRGRPSATPTCGR
jgi:quinoprotein glucose dehydrogenase